MSKCKLSIEEILDSRDKRFQVWKTCKDIHKHLEDKKKTVTEIDFVNLLYEIVCYLYNIKKPAIEFVYDSTNDKFTTQTVVAVAYEVKKGS